MKRWLGPALRYRIQSGGLLGDRLAASFEEMFEAGHNEAIIIGTDCPDLDQRVLRLALESLRHNPLVLGPALDGGYYLIGLTREAWQLDLRYLFHDMEWGGETVLQTTTDRARKHNLPIAFLESLADVDRPADLQHWQRIIGG